MTALAAMPCPRCSAEVRPEQDWCLECGAAARTRIARTPAWRIPVFLVVFVIALSGAAVAFAFVRLSNTDDDLRAAQTTQTAPPAAAPTQTAPDAAPPATAPTPPPATTTAAPPATAPPQPSPFTTTTTTTTAP